METLSIFSIYLDRTQGSGRMRRVLIDQGLMLCIWDLVTEALLEGNDVSGPTGEDKNIGY